MNLNYILNHEYRYPNHKQKFKLVKVTGWVYHFACGHRCTDSVFMDLIDCSTGIQVYKNHQLQLFKQVA